MATAEDKAISDLRILLGRIQENLTSIYESMEKVNEVFLCLEDAKKSENLSQDAPINAKLSDAGRFAIENSVGPLKPEDLRKFLMVEAFGRPKPEVLPILRRYTPLVEEVVDQLNAIKDINNEGHMRYKEEQRRLDVNLNKRIDKLVANMRKELAKEASEKRSQMSMDVFITKLNN